MSRVEYIAQFACACSAQSEGIGPAPRCWRCDRPMYQWGEREADYAPSVLTAAKADTRTATGDY